MKPVTNLKLKRGGQSPTTPESPLGLYGFAQRSLQLDLIFV